jgi:hypothetical protein
MQKYKDSCIETQPVIYVGVERQEAKGFDSIKLILEDAKGLIYSESHIKGVISVRMVNNILEIYVKERG